MLCLAMTAGTVQAQGRDQEERLTERLGGFWYGNWSPLRPIASLARTLPSAPALPDLAGTAAPQVGLFWSGGNPAAAALDVTRDRSGFRGSVGADEGPYHRPFDPDDVQARELEALGWRPFGRRSAAAGRVLVLQHTLGRAGPGSFERSYESNPFVTADTTNPEVRRIGARLEGALAHRVGGWAFGVALGYDGRDSRTTRARVPRLSRSSTPAATIGVTRRLPGAITLGAHGRWVGGDETITIPPQPGVTTGYHVGGYYEPDEFTIAPPSLYQRWIERDATAAGVSASGGLAGVTWLVLAERTSRDERQFSRRAPGSPVDTWNADGYAVMGALQRRLPLQLTITGFARYETLDGAAQRADLQGDIFRASENALRLRGDLRFSTKDERWSIAMLAAADREERTRRDFISSIGTAITAWSGGASIEVARALDQATLISIGGGFAQRASTTTIPNPTTLGTIGQWLIGPELAMEATQSRPIAFGARIRRSVGSGVALLFGGQREVLEPVGDPTVPLVPTGDRVGWNVALGVVLERDSEPDS